MGKVSVVLWDSDENYVKKLTAGLQKQFRDKAIIRGVTGELRDVSLENEEVHLMLCSKRSGEDWCRTHPECVCIWLDEEKDGLTMGIWQDCIFKYQSISAIARNVSQYLPEKTRKIEAATAHTKQLWYGVVSPVRHESMLPFACGFAQHIGETKNVLVVVLMEFSGLEALLELPKCQGIEEFMLRLRKQTRNELEKIPFPSVRMVQGFDLMLGPNNPSVLYELGQEDVEGLVQRIQFSHQYDAVVWVAGNMIPGIAALFRCSETVFCVEKTDTYSQCCQQEFQHFFKKMNVFRKDEVLVPVQLPLFSWTGTGEHLLLQWKESAIGEVGRKYWKEEDGDGELDRSSARGDFATGGHEW